MFVDQWTPLEVDLQYWICCLSIAILYYDSDTGIQVAESGYSYICVHLTYMHVLWHERRGMTGGHVHAVNFKAFDGAQARLQMQLLYALDHQCGHHIRRRQIQSCRGMSICTAMQRLETGYCTLPVHPETLRSIRWFTQPPG